MANLVVGHHPRRADRPVGGTLNLTATPTPASISGGWSGGRCHGTAACKIVANPSPAVSGGITAPAPTAPTLTVRRTGEGAVTSGTLVTVAGTPKVGWIFAGASGGGCTGTATRGVEVDAETSVSAIFQARRR